MDTSKRRQVGERLPSLQFSSLHGETVGVPNPNASIRLIHLQFRRFAGCPVCNLHLQSFARAHGRISNAGVLTVAFFHSRSEQMMPYQGQLPFPCVADAERRWYRYFGVERSAAAVAHPRVVGAALKGLFTAPSNPFVGGWDQTGLPADLLIDRSNVVVAARYGAHANDQWSVDELLELAGTKA
ncbi:MAG TPA: redoxin domain-containing protein [Polyangiaceae bacterium]|nr:redoxin domain-containing protein [Polyangiaceae bacterium]